MHSDWCCDKQNDTEMLLHGTNKHLSVTSGIHSQTPVSFGLSRHNFGDTELKFSLFNLLIKFMYSLKLGPKSMFDKTSMHDFIS